MGGGKRFSKEFSGQHYMFFLPFSLASLKRVHSGMV